MMKKLMAVAVVSAFAAPVFAQTSNVTLYGRANLGLDNYRAYGATDGGDAASFKSRNRVYDSGSRLGVRGVEDLGNGLRAIFQIESGVNIDSGTTTGQGGQASPNAGLLASRDSFVGLDGGFGRLTFGRQSIYWVNGTIAQSGANYINAEVNWYNAASFGRVAGPAARASNVLLYTTPTFGGFNATLGYSPQSEAAQASGATTALNQGSQINGRIYGATVRWATGPISLQSDYWVNQGAQNVTNNFGDQRTTGFKFLAGFTYMPGAQISGIFSQNRNYNVGALSAANTGFNAPGLPGAQTNFTLAGDDVRQNMFGVNWEHTFGNVQALAQFSITRNASGCTATQTIGGASDNGCKFTGSRGVMVGARYLMSKRTAVYGSFNQIWNDKNAVADYAGGAITSSSGGVAPRGADPRIIGVGIIHNF